MKKFFRSVIRSLAIVTALFLGHGTSQAQMNIALVPTADPEVFEFHWTAGAPYSAIINSVFTVKWDAAAGGTISIDDFVNVCSNSRAPLSDNGAEVEVVGGFRYFTFRCDGSSALGTAPGLNCAFNAGQTRVLHQFRIAGISGCPNIGLTNDAYVTGLNRDYFVSVGGTEVTGTFLSGQLGVPFTVTPGSYGPTCSTGADIALLGTPAGGTWSGTGVTGNSFDPSVGTQTLTYSVTQGACTVAQTTLVTVSAAPTATISYSGTPYCSNEGTATVTQTGTTGGTYTAPAGLSINASTGAVNLALSTAGTYTVTYTIAAAGGCTQFQTTTSITVTTASAATISYSGTPYCSNEGTATVTQTGTTGGTYSAPAGLSINASTGAVNLALSTAGTYTVTYTMAATGGCPLATATTSIAITAASAATVSYSGTPYCSNEGTATVTQTGTTGGTYSAPAGLSINASTGAVNLALSTAGTYTVTYTMAATGGCPLATATTSIAITAASAATISYSGSPYCSNAGTATVTQTGTTGGTYSAPAGLSINASTGAVNLALSTAGAYTVTYTMAATGGCTQATATTSIGVTAATTWFQDSDGDGAGNPAVSQQACGQPIGYVANSNDGCPADPAKIAPGACGCGVADTDSDGDGTPNCNDACPADPNKIAAGTCGCGNPEPGTACNDNNPNTTGDVIGANCVCAGSTIPCPDDGNPCTLEEVVGGVCLHTPLPDTDLDGTCDLIDGCPNDPNKIAAGICGCGTSDVDTDGDLTADCNDACPADPNKIAAGTCGCGNPEPGTACNDNNPNTSGDVIGANCVCAGSTIPCPDDGNPCTLEEVVGGVCLHTPLPDTDLDGTCDLIDGCPNDPNKIAAGICGCGTSDADTDGDLTADCNDGCPNDPNKTSAGICGCGTSDIDTDGDLTADCNDACPSDPNKIAAGSCGCGNPEPGTACNDNNPNTSGDVIGSNCMCAGSTIPCPDDGNPCTLEEVVGGVCLHTPLPDTDLDGTCDLIDGCPNDPNKIAAGICGCGTSDVDTDGDLTADCNDECPNDPNKIAAGSCGCGNPEPGTACNDNNPNTSGDVIGSNCVCAGSTIPCPDDGNPCTLEEVVGGVCLHTPLPDTDLDGTCDLVDGCPVDPNKISAGTCGCGNPEPGTACNDNNPDTSGDVINGNCVCAGTPTGCDQSVVLVLGTDANPGETTWEVVPEGGGAPICSGGPYPGIANSTFGVQCCLADGCYALRVLDSAGDGMTTGGYVLKESGANGRRIIDNTGDGVFGSVSQISGGQGFCLPIGNDRLIYSNCDRTYWLPNQYAVATENTAVSATWVVGGANSVQPSNSGYEFWVFDPDGSYSFRRFRSHNVSDGFAPASALRACHMKINSWLNTVLTPHIPANVMMNVRVRGRIGGQNVAFGPACRFKIDPIQAQCPPTTLVTDPNNQYYSCGVSRTFGGTARLYAWSRTGATRYQFEFTLPAEGNFTRVVTTTSQYVVLNWAQDPLQNGVTYNVRVRISRDQGQTWCAYGDVCLVTINNGSGLAEQDGANAAVSMTATPTLMAWPNPNRGDQLNINLTHVSADVKTVGIELYDLYGKQVAVRMIAVQDGVLNTTLDLDGGLSSGVYLMRVVAGTFTTSERIVIQR